MGEKYLLKLEQLSTWLAKLAENARVIAPVMRADELRFDNVTDPGEVHLGQHNTRRPPKWVFFPQTERLLSYGRKLDDYGQIKAAELDNTPQVLLGAAPCDARSFILLDRVFGQGVYQDPYYCARRANTLVISCACEHPTSTCFCQNFHSGPADSSGSDVMLYPAGDAFIVQLITEAGERAAADWHLPLADKAALVQSEHKISEAAARLSPANPADGIEKDLAGLFDSTMWRDVAEKCIACGTCTYNCPECHCFNIVDNQLASGGERVRGWDSCMFPQFTQQASGYNPRPDQGTRWRQRIMHKFSYLPANVGLYGCVGCGRCIISCPVRLDIRQVLTLVRQEAHAKAEAAVREGR
ncbi:MAG: 4Fe-4S dicluster domain-containing protein [Anaerolineae bacterium]